MYLDDVCDMPLNTVSDNVVANKSRSGRVIKPPIKLDL